MTINLGINGFGRIGRSTLAHVTESGRNDVHVTKINATADAEQEIAATIPLGFLGTPDDIAHTVVFLSSSASRWITGRNILVAGGRTHRAYQYQQRLEEE